MASVATDISRAGTDTLVFPKNDDDNECKVPPQAYNTYATGIVMPYTAYLVKTGSQLTGRQKSVFIGTVA